MAKNPIHTQTGDKASLKFNGKLDVTKGNTASLIKLNLEGLLIAISSIVERFGLEILFYLPDKNETTKYLPEDPHIFTLASVLA